MLSGGIPTQLGNLTALQIFYLGRNPLGGTIPAQLGNLTNLNLLALDSAQLTGTLPAELGNLTGLTFLILDTNGLTGPIPSSIGNLTNLMYLYLNDNQLTGSIPTTLGSLANLRYLFLYNNQLSGNLPPQLGNLSNIQLFYLSNNAFTGAIPTEIGNLTTMTYLNVASNALVGEIPSSLTNLVNLINNNNDLRFNGLYASDATLRTFLNGKQAGNDWESWQTVAPTNLAAGLPTGSSVPLTWNPILYTLHSGGYEVYFSTTSGGPYTLFETTADKTVGSTTVTGLSQGTTYYFRLRTVTNSNPNNQNTIYSDYTNEISVRTPDDGQVLPVVTIVAATPNASETGPTPGAFTVSRTGDTTASLTVFYTIGGTAANGTDYSSVAGNVTIQPNFASTLVTITPVDDVNPEGAETVILTLSDNLAYTVGVPASATVTIADNDSPVVTIVATTPNASEAGPTQGAFTVSRTGDTTAALTVFYTIGGTAANGADYNSLTGSVTIQPNFASALITIIPVDDAIPEGGEMVILTLSNNLAYTVGVPASATVTITDNDSAAAPIAIPTMTDLGIIALIISIGTGAVCRLRRYQMPSKQRKN